MGSGVARRHTPNDRATFPGILFRQHRKHSRACPHRKARLAARFAHRQPVCGFDQTIWLRQHDQRRARWRCRLRIALPARPRPKSAVDLALSDRPRVRRRRALLDHALPRGREFLDRPGPRPGLRLLQFPQHCALSGRNFSADFSIHFRLDRSGRDHCKYSSAAAHQTARTTRLATVAPGDCLHNYLLVIARFLAFCPAPLLQRQLVKSTANARNLVKSLRKISACAFGEMFLIKPPFLAPKTAGAPELWPNQRKRKLPQKGPRRAKQRRLARSPPKDRHRKKPRELQKRRQNIRRSVRQNFPNPKEEAKTRAAPSSCSAGIIARRDSTPSPAHKRRSCFSCAMPWSIPWPEWRRTRCVRAPKAVRLPPSGCTRPTPDRTLTIAISR